MMREIHLLVACHGLWGNVEHLQSLDKTLLDKFAAEKDDPKHPKLITLLCSQNSEVLTYDGIDLCAERVVQEIDKTIQEIEADGKQKVTRFSMVGYSLGGLIARFSLGILHSRSPSFFENRKAVNFTTFASPAIGIPKYNSFGASFFHFLGSRLLSRSGSQMYGTDKFINDKPMVEMLASPQTSFVKALQLFEQIRIYANTVNDRTVPFPTAGIRKNDPFARAMQKAQKARRKRGADIDEPLDLREGGLQVDTDPEYPAIVTSYKEIEPVPHVGNPEGGSGKSKLSILPFYLKPSFYVFFPKPLRYAVVFGFPVVVPALVGFVIIRFVIQGQASRRRIHSLLVGDLQTAEGRLQRVGLSDRIAEAMDDMIDMGPSTNDDDEEEPSAHKSDSSQPIFSQPQLNAIANMNDKSRLPQLEYVLVYLPNSRNAHGTIVARTPSFMDHVKGFEILKHYAENFIL